MSDKIKTYIYQFSAVVVLLSAMFFSINPMAAPYSMALGALGVVAGTLLQPYKGKNFRVRRLFHMQVLGGLFMVAAAVFMFFHLKYWVMCLLIGGILTLYSAFMIPAALKSENPE